MPLNKFASWGAAPVAVPRPPGLGAVTRAGLSSLNNTLRQRLPGPGGGRPTPATPTTQGLRVVWSLGAVRDALTDQGSPSADSTNEQIDVRADSAAVEDLSAFLELFHPRLHPLYLRQFRHLTQDDSGFDQERRERLAELLAFELDAMAMVEDPPQIPIAARQARRSTKRR